MRFRRRPSDRAGRGAAFVHVRGGYHPAVIHGEVGVPLRVVFQRDESSPCSEQVVFPALGKSTMLPRGERVVVELEPAVAGEFDFTCAMGMLHGTLVVSPRGTARS